MIYLIAGRSGSGKDYLAKLLVEKGLKQVISYTTRSIRSEEDAKSHIFISKEEAATITDKVASTVINDNEYFATAEQVNASDVYIIDPNGIDVLVKNMPDTIFHIIYVVANDDLNRRLHAVKRADDKIKEEQIFEARDAAEDEQFSKFEERIQDPKLESFPKNVMFVDTYVNNYDPIEAERRAKEYALDAKMLKRLVKLLDSVSGDNIPPRDPDDPLKIAVPVKENSDERISISAEYYADILLHTTDENEIPTDLYHFMINYVLEASQFAD